MQTKLDKLQACMRKNLEAAIETAAQAEEYKLAEELSEQLKALGAPAEVETSLKVWVPAKKVGIVIGTNGAAVKKLQAQSGVASVSQPSKGVKVMKLGTQDYQAFTFKGAQNTSENSAVLNASVLMH